MRAGDSQGCPGTHRLPWVTNPIGLSKTPIPGDPSRALSPYIRNRWRLEQGFPGGTIYAIAGTADGYLWIGSEKGLVRFDGVNFRLFDHATSPTLPTGPVLDLPESAEGELWLRMQSPGVLRHHDGAFQDVSQTLAWIETPITAMFQQPDGDLRFLALGNSTLEYRHGKLTQQRFRTDRPNFLVVSMAETKDGRIWLGTRDTACSRSPIVTFRPFLAD
jgi:ligand-binding sensor domain-containing protein